MKRSFRLVLGFSVLFSVSAFADWEADFSAVSSTKDFPRITGKFYSKVDRFRVDSSYPFDMSVYAKSGSNRVYAGIHSFKIRLSSSPERFSGQLPPCLSDSFEKCAKDFKLKKSGTEKCGDHDCEIYEGSNIQGMKSVRLWHWQGEKEPIFAKMLLTKKNGSQITTNFSKIEKKSRNESFYVVPANYKDAGSLETFIGDFQGKSSE